MKMLMVVVPHSLAKNILDALISSGHTATFVESRGGMLQQSQLTLFIAVKEQEVNPVVAMIRNHCRTEITEEESEAETRSEEEKLSITAQLGGSVIFIWDLERFETA
jgi:uncharacterized protein YaaQ